MPSLNYEVCATLTCCSACWCPVCHTCYCETCATKALTAPRAALCVPPCRQEAAAERAELEAIKARKLREMEAAGVPAKYRTELEKMRVGSAK